MTSKEALKEIKNLIEHEHLEEVIDTTRYFNLIKKDLDLLETFEKHLVIDENNNVWLKVETDYTGYVKIKGIQWDELRRALENEKINS